MHYEVKRNLIHRFSITVVMWEVRLQNVIILTLTENSLESDLEDCRHASLIPDADFLAESVNKMLGRTKQVLRVGKDIQNKSDDPVYRNGIQVFMDQIQNGDYFKYHWELDMDLFICNKTIYVPMFVSIVISLGICWNLHCNCSISFLKQ